ncbi:putative 6-phosphofructo-2-kinase/fructose-2,6-bisphosphatase [Aphelenchoides besseyi]|nr:putative 6-phosphofructo-2-kinase/fructose-2,6-bisphosphatase [Aphelenchoides besseyi]KAI6192708.1 putative 6-phosphofructo-2-kinase/fructose-2,6-bisphosphatase [Aphelenchoides besseyi]
MHTRVHVHQYSTREQVRVPNVIALVGLPARGKTYISHKLCRYLQWCGIKTRAFNVGEYRRRACNLDEQGAADFFNPNNQEGIRIRDQCAKLAMEDMGRYLQSKEGEVAIFDATNTTRERRNWLVQFCKREEHDPKFRIFFIESVCDDPEIINSNIAEVKISSPDYKNRMTEDQAKEDFLKRIENYKSQYEPLDEEIDDELSFIKVINAGRSFYVHSVQGHVQSRVVYFLMNIHLLPRSIYLTRGNQITTNSSLGRLGGDSPLSENGLRYAQKLRRYFEEEKIPGDLRIWSSQKIRAAQTANHLKDLAAHVEYWKVLDEIDAGICEGLTYEDFQTRYPKQFAERDKDKYHFRYPSGESYEDLVARLEPVIMELERQSNVLVVSHQAVLRCILAYFDNKDRNELPYLNVPLHTVIKLTPKAYSCQIEMFKFKVDAVDTYRAKPDGTAVMGIIEHRSPIVPFALMPPLVQPVLAPLSSKFPDDGPDVSTLGFVELTETIKHPEQVKEQAEVAANVLTNGVVDVHHPPRMVCGSVPDK